MISHDHEPQWVQPDTKGDGTPGVEPPPVAEPELSLEGRLLLAEAQVGVLENEVRRLEEHTFAIVRHITDKPKPPPDRSWVTTEPAERNPRRNHGKWFGWLLSGLVCCIALVVGLGLWIPWSEPTSVRPWIAPIVVLFDLAVLGAIALLGQVFDRW